jgi:hypothetical protein
VLLDQLGVLPAVGADLLVLGKCGGFPVLLDEHDGLSGAKQEALRDWEKMDLPLH